MEGSAPNSHCVPSLKSDGSFLKCDFIIFVLYNFPVLISRRPDESSVCLDSTVEDQQRSELTFSERSHQCLSGFPSEDVQVCVCQGRAVAVSLYQSEPEWGQAALRPTLSALLQTSQGHTGERLPSLSKVT